MIRQGSTYHLYLINWLAGRWTHRASIASDLGTPEVEAVRRTEAAKGLEWFFKAPLWTILSPGLVKGTDLRFQSLVLDRTSDHFSFYFDLENGAVRYHGTERPARNQ